ncbi:MAG: hypothetical protein CMJ64_19625 [Planctomycetaceae bacterium]|nr:hypothetical protein [Planctomycetaceae bacterium]
MTELAISNLLGLPMTGSRFWMRRSTTAKHLVKAFSQAEARRLSSHLEFHNTPSTAVGGKDLPANRDLTWY